MKAWSAQNDWTGIGVVVFAETRGQARALLLHSDEFEGFDYIEIPVYRASLFDECYRGEWQMDWYNAEDKMALCKAGWSCIDDAFDPEDCKLCPANKYCNKWEDYQEEMRDDI